MNRSLKYGLYVLVFLTALGISAHLTAMFLIKGQPEVEVPDLTGRGAVEALKTLSDLGLNLKVQAIDYSETIPKDHIISQDPPPGSRLKQKRKVMVVLSQGSATIPLPDLKGLSLEQARTILEHSRLELGTVSYMYGWGTEKDRDRILAQVPEPLQPTPIGTKVDLLLSRGPRQIHLIMPDLTGQPYSLALFSLERAGLALGRLETDLRPDWPAETVVVQDPPPGNRVAPGTLVRLTVNREPDQDPAEYSFHILEHDLPFGLLRRQVRIRVAIGSYLWDIHDQWHQPGERVLAVVLSKGPPRAQVFEDGVEQLRPAADEFLLGVMDDQDFTFDSLRRLHPSG